MGLMLDIQKQKLVKYEKINGGGVGISERTLEKIYSKSGYYIAILTSLYDSF